jgi:hypothetical protein
VTAARASVGTQWAYGAGAGGARGAVTAALYAVLLVLSLIVLEAGDPVPPGGEDNYIPFTPGSFFLYAFVVLNIAGIAGVVGLVLGASFGLALAPLVRVMRARPRALAATVFIVLISGGLPLLRDVDLGSTLTRVEQVVLHAVLPSAMAGAAAVWHVLWAAGAAHGGPDRPPLP